MFFFRKFAKGPGGKMEIFGFEGGQSELSV